ncbi:MAG: choice-of-anchor J domain-containing protein [Muribaculaceae bacterium]|nr:choice-of-anchor J domain-containing protein [Muribaculaceae bacterium]
MSFLASYAQEIKEEKNPYDGKAFKELRMKAGKKRSKGASVFSAPKNAPSKKAPQKSKYVGDGPFEFGVSLVYAYDIDMGIYSLSDVGIFTEVAIGWLYDASYGGIKSDGKYFVAFNNGPTFYNVLFDAITWKQIKGIDTASITTFSSALAEDPTDGTIYGCFLSANGEDLEFGTLDINEFKRTSTICTLDMQWEAASFDENGTLYVLLGDGTLNTVDKTTGKHTLVGQTGIPMLYLSTGIIHHRDGKFYYISCTDDNSKLYTINLKTAEAEELMDFGEDMQMRGMFVGEPLADDKAPFAPSYPVLEFDKGAIEGYVSFTSPDKLYDGSQPSGNLTWHLYRTDNEVASGSTEWGRDERVPFAVPRAGFYRVSVAVSNDVGLSPMATIRCYIGNDFPKAPAKVSLEREGNKNILNWTAVTEGANGSYVDPEAITYKVYRYPDNSVIADGLTTTTYTDIVEEPGNTTVYRYAITATFDGREGDPIISEDLMLGALRLPFFEDFTSANAAEKFKVIDANGDGRTWEHSRQNSGMFNPYCNDGYMDDWLVTPPVYMEAGRRYSISFDAWESFLQRGNKERVAAYIGMSPTPNGMNHVIVEPTVVAERVNLGGDFVPTESGSYYFGIHGCSDPKEFYLYVSNISIEDGVFDNSPARGEMTVLPDYNCENKATISIVAPTLDVTGHPLTALTKIIVKRDGDTQVFEKLNPQPGESLEFIDEVPAPGYYTYSLVAFIESGAGKILEVRNHIGMNLPGAPTNVAIKEIENSGKVEITWEAPEGDNDGNPMNPDLLSYSIFDFENDEIAAYLTGYKYTYQATSSARQEFVLFYVHAESDAGLNEYKFGTTPLTAVGTPYTIPYSESFSNGTLGSQWAQGGVGDWSIIASSNDPNTDSQDGDNGMVCWTPTSYGTTTTGRFFSGKISLVGAESPALSFYYYADAESDGSFEVTVRNLTEGGVAQPVASFKIADGDGWTPVVVNLEDYKGFNVEVGITADRGTGTRVMLFDNFRILNMVPDNLSAEAFSVPRNVYAGEPVNANVRVTNLGSNNADDFTVSLYCNRQKVAQSESLSLEAGKSVDVVLEYKTTPFSESLLTCYAEINYERDSDTSDNTTTRATVDVLESPYPAVKNLQRVDGDKPAMKWETPDLTDQSAERVTDDFEDYVSFDLNPVGKWTFIDMDGSPTYAISKVNFPNNGARMAYLVFDSSWNGLGKGYDAYSGTKYMASMASTIGYNDDWMISPVLSGDAQTVSFYARSYTDAYNLEAFRFMISSTGNNPEDFEEVELVVNVPITWTRYMYALPEGTKYFAIRCVSQDSFIFMVDDVTYTPQSPLVGLELNGYNVYREGEQIGTPKAETFVDENPLAGSATYHVTVQYNKGESVLSEALLIEYTGVDNAIAANVELEVSGRTVTVRNADGNNVNIYSVDGVLQFAATGDCSTTLAPGIYLVTVGEKTEKILIY